jgi:diacylglycerol kinase (ATP)
MKRYMVIYNPTSGREMAGNKIFQASKIAVEKGDIEISFFATKKKGDAESRAEKACGENYDMIIACGGDGTVYEVVNGIMKSEKRTKLAILPAGTVNHFASQLNMPTSPNEFAEMMLNEKYNSIDVGCIGSTYFVNV